MAEPQQDNNHEDENPTITRENSERIFLGGPHSRFRELKFVWRVVKEFIHGFRHLHFVGPCITVFGSARFTEDHTYYQLAHHR